MASNENRQLARAYNLLALIFIAVYCGVLIGTFAAVFHFIKTLSEVTP